MTIRGSTESFHSRFPTIPESKLCARRRLLFRFPRQLPSPEHTDFQTETDRENTTKTTRTHLSTVEIPSGKRCPLEMHFFRCDSATRKRRFFHFSDQLKIPAEAAAVAIFFFALLGFSSPAAVLFTRTSSFSFRRPARPASTTSPSGFE